MTSLLRRRTVLQNLALAASAAVLGRARPVMAQAAAGAVASPPPQPPTFGTPVDGLRLGLQWRDNFTLAFVLENVSPAPITVLSHVMAGDTHLDGYELLLESATHTAPPRVLRFVERRTRSARAIVALAPGAQLSHTVDTRRWGRSPSNPIPPGWHTSPTYLLTLSYDTRNEAGVWRGRLVAGQQSTWIDTGT